MTRSLSEDEKKEMNGLDPNRDNLGTGMLTVTRFIDGNQNDQRKVKLVKGGILKFDAIVIDSHDPKPAMKIVKDEQYTLEWDCYCTTAGPAAPPLLRAYKIRFVTQGQLAAFLMACYRLSHSVLQECFIVGSRFYEPPNPSLPPHFQRSGARMMQADGRIRQRRSRPLSFQQEQEYYGSEANTESQEY